MNALIYDCEIIKAIPPKDGLRIEGIEYCEGWHDHANMGISVIGAYDYIEDRYRVFMKDNFKIFQQLVDERKTIIGFNSIAFDNQLCREAEGIHISDEKSWDLLVEIWKGAGLGLTFEYPTHAGYGLNAVAACNLGEMKSGHGAKAPVLWQRGEYGEVVDYCLQDVALTRKLVDQVVAHGFLKNPKSHGSVIGIQGP